MAEPRPVVLYAEDSEDDAFLMRRAFAKVAFPGELHVVTDGEEAIRYLAGEAPASAAEAPVPPRLVLLDVNMPRVGGIEVLRWIRARAVFHALPVLMLSSSSQPSDIARAREAGADAYLVKPSSLTAFRALVEDLVVLCAASGRPQAGLRLRGAVS